MLFLHIHVIALSSKLPFNKWILFPSMEALWVKFAFATFALHCLVSPGWWADLKNTFPNAIGLW